MKLIGFCKFFNDKDNLGNMLTEMNRICDLIVLCDDSSTDGSKEIAERFTKHIITLPDDFEAEGEHKQKLLEYIRGLDLQDDAWILQLDSDEVLDKPEEIKNLCEFLNENGYDSALFHLKNLFLSNQWYRLDNQFNSLWKLNLWKFSELKFDISRGLHKPQNPINLSKPFHSNISILHFGFSTPDLIAKKYKKYKSLGQQGYALERLKPTIQKMNLKSLNNDILEPEPKPLTEQQWEDILNA